MLGWQRNCDITNANEMFLFDLMLSIVQILFHKEVLDVVAKVSCTEG